jgi:phosphoserine phosphatase
MLPAVRERRFTGVVTDAYGDNKWVRTAAWAKRNRVDLANCTFYTDSVSDRKCVSGLSAEPTAPSLGLC